MSPISVIILAAPARQAKPHWLKPQRMLLRPRPVQADPNRAPLPLPPAAGQNLAQHLDQVQLVQTLLVQVPLEQATLVQVLQALLVLALQVQAVQAQVVQVPRLPHLLLLNLYTP